MPTYVYRCRDCEHVFEEFQRITAEPGATCPVCGRDDCSRQITGGAFHLKGSGWYASDYSAAKPAPKVESPPECNGKGPEGGCGACVEPSVATA